MLHQPFEPIQPDRDRRRPASPGLAALTSMFADVDWLRVGVFAFPIMLWAFSIYEVATHWHVVFGSC